MINPITLTGQKILVTGASQGIGQASAVLLAELGAALVLVARNQSALEDLRRSLPGSGHVVLPCDLSDHKQFGDLFAKACENGEKFTGFLHAAGIAPVLPLKALSSKVLHDVFDINFFSFMELTKYFIKPKFSTGGSIVAISSVSALAGWQGLSAYGASKGALISAVKSLAVELAPRKYRVNTIAPSNIKTEMLEKMLAMLSDDEVAKVEAKQPLGFGKPEDVANAAAFLLSSASSFITGTVLVVDGGYLAL